jgi:hypothetical protein
MLTRRANKRLGCRAEKYAIDANRVIAENLTPQSGAHSDIRHPQVLWAIASAAHVSASYLGVILVARTMPVPSSR